MALTRYPSFGPGQPGMVEIGLESTFATLSSNMAFIKTIDNIGGLESIHKLMLEDETLRQDLNALAMIPGFEDGDGYFVLPEGTQVTTKHYLTGFSQTVPTGKTEYSDAGDTATGFPLIWAVYAALGGLHVMDALDATATGCTEQDLEVATTTDIDIGGMLTVDVSATATADYESGWVQDFVDGDPGDDTASLRVDLSAAPASSKDVFGSVVAYVKSYLEDSFSLRWTGHKVDSTTPLRCTLIGCVAANLNFDLPVFGTPSVEITWTVSAAMWDDASATGVTPQTWTYPAPEQAIGHRVQYVAGMVHNAAIALPSTSVTISVDNQLAQLPSLGATYGPMTYVKTAQDIQVTLRTPYSAALRQAYADQTDFGIEVEIGSQPGKRVGVALPGLHMMSFSGPVSENGVAYCDITARVTSYTGDTGSGTDADPVDKAMAVAWG